MTFDNLRWVKAHGHDITHLTPEEADELDTLQFRRSTDLPFGLEAEARYNALIAKGKGAATPTAHRGAI